MEPGHEAPHGSAGRSGLAQGLPFGDPVHCRASNSVVGLLWDLGVVRQDCRRSQGGTLQPQGTALVVVERSPRVGPGQASLAPSTVAS